MANLFARVASSTHVLSVLFLVSFAVLAVAGSEPVVAANRVSSLLHLLHHFRAAVQVVQGALRRRQLRCHRLRLGLGWRSNNHRRGLRLE